ncbi:predicted protein [Sclerotinia sclerotiorum 1980 UF-70]|uniref:Uncharacterized protein n=1 Tax=Sclerotinia sclerotiorum (strain ATCC 18683 / 1980 / Ss-1) TaxID=665079 RepID=A7ELB8_SCLS1|nr:predicted protein [Sclerotinia sclerotiorum 1980 UF-70]EDO03634.1 predicted protein [Sclerotinia sclerotiorum 1980 UF-70]
MDEPNARNYHVRNMLALLNRRPAHVLDLKSLEMTRFAFHLNKVMAISY